MLKHKFCLIALCFLGNGFLSADINTADTFKMRPEAELLTEGVRIPIPDDELKNKWIMVNDTILPSSSWVLEWVPKGENAENWTQLIQIQFFPEKEFISSVSGEAFAYLFVTALKGKFPDVKVTEFSKSTENVLLEWSLSEEAGSEAQDELARFISTKQGLYRIAYTQKVPDMKQASRDIWKARLANAKIVENERKPSEVGSAHKKESSL